MTSEQIEKFHAATTEAKRLLDKAKGLRHMARLASNYDIAAKPYIGGILQEILDAEKPLGDLVESARQDCFRIGLIEAARRNEVEAGKIMADAKRRPKKIAAEAGTVTDIPTDEKVQS